MQVVVVDQSINEDDNKVRQVLVKAGGYTLSWYPLKSRWSQLVDDSKELRANLPWSIVIGGRNGDRLVAAPIESSRQPCVCRAWR
jgi:hypothetical protein